MGMVAHAFNPSPREAEAGESPWVLGLPIEIPSQNKQAKSKNKKQKQK